jgi:fibronectin-binding autotransporter adhesin
MKTLPLYLAAYLACLPTILFGQASWNGSVSGQWSTAGNWSGTVPTNSSSQSLVFNAASLTGAAVLSTNNDLTGLTASGTTAITFDNLTGTGAFTIAGNAISLGGNILTTGTTGTPTHTISAGLILTGSRTITAINDNNLTISGSISQNTSTARNLIKSGAGILTLTGSNSFTGEFRAQQGTTVFNSIANVGSNSALGAGNVIRMANGTIHASMIYTGPAASSDRQVQIGAMTVAASDGSATFENNGSGPLTFTNANFNVLDSAANTPAAARKLTLGGTQAGDNTIQGILADNNTGGGGIISLEKTGVGTWVLAGANTYTGSTTLRGGGTLRAGSSTAFGSVGSISMESTGSTLELANGVNISRPLTVTDVGNAKNLQLQSGATSGTYSGNITVDETVANNFVLRASTGGTLNVTGTLSGPGGISKQGTGIVSLNAPNTLAGAVTVSAGTLEVNNTSGSGTGSGPVTVGTGAILSGDGAITSAVNNFVTVNGTIQVGQVGASSGTDLSISTSGSGSTLFTPGSILGVDLWSTSGTDMSGTLAAADLLRLTGNVGISGSTIAFGNPSALAFQEGDMFRIIDWAGVITRTGTFATDFTALALGPGLMVDSSSLYTSGTISIVAAMGIPEPSRALLWAIGMAGLFQRRRR